MTTLFYQACIALSVRLARPVSIWLEKRRARLGKRSCPPHVSCFNFVFLFSFFACPVRLAFPFPFHPEKPDTEWVKGVVFRRHWWRAGLRAAAAAATKLVWLWLCQRERGPSAFGPLALWCLGEQSEMARVGERGGG